MVLSETCHPRLPGAPHTSCLHCPLWKLSPASSRLRSQRHFQVNGSACPQFCLRRTLYIPFAVVALEVSSQPLLPESYVCTFFNFNFYRLMLLHCGSPIAFFFIERLLRSLQAVGCILSLPPDPAASLGLLHPRSRTQSGGPLPCRCV